MAKNRKKKKISKIRHSRVVDGTFWHGSRGFISSTVGVFFCFNFFRKSAGT